MFNEIKIECDASDEEIFDFKEIDNLTENKVKIFCKDNSFIKQEFNFNINECQHKYPKREILIKNKNKINIKNILMHYIEINTSFPKSLLIFGALLMEIILIHKETIYLP